MIAARTLGEGLRLLLYRAGLKQEVIAAELGVSTASVSAYLNDASLPNAVALRRLAQFLADKLERPAEELWTELGELLDATAVLLQLEAEAQLLATDKERKARPEEAS